MCLLERERDSKALVRRGKAPRAPQGGGGGGGGQRRGLTISNFNLSPSGATILYQNPLLAVHLNSTISKPHPQAENDINYPLIPVLGGGGY